MQDFFKYITLSFLIISCASQDDAPGTSSGSSLPVRFITNVNEMVARTETRSAIDGTHLPQGDTVGIFGITFQNRWDDYIAQYSEYDSYEDFIKAQPEYKMRGKWGAEKYHYNLYNTPYVVHEETTNGNRLETEWETKFESGEKKGIVFFAYYPYIPYIGVMEDGSGNKLGMGFRTFINMNALEKTPDYLFAKKVQRNTEDAVTLSFRHMMARLNIYFYTDKSYSVLDGIRRHARLKTILVTMRSSPLGQFQLYNDDEFSDIDSKNAFMIKCYNPSLDKDTVGRQDYMYGRDSICYITAPNSSSIEGRNAIRNVMTEAGLERSFLLYELTNITDIKFVIKNTFSQKIDTLTIRDASKIQDLCSLLRVRRSVNLFVQYSPTVPVHSTAGVAEWPSDTASESRNGGVWYLTDDDGNLYDTTTPPTDSGEGD